MVIDVHGRSFWLRVLLTEEEKWWLMKFTARYHADHRGQVQDGTALTVVDADDAGVVGELPKTEAE